MAPAQKVRNVLGLDLGANSVGWALVEFRDKQPFGITASGARVFEAGVDGQLEAGREESRTVERRGARQRRRQTDRRSRRMANVCSALQRSGLLPQCDAWSGTARHAMLKEIDQTIVTRHASNGTESNGLAQLPYHLRDRALDEKLELHEIGRAIYHLAQRRGFLSNRKTGGDDEESGEVKPAISRLAREIENAGARTLGEYLHGVDPIVEQRLRRRWTARQMYQDEFDAIWSAQSAYYPQILTDKRRKELYDSIFLQRPLKSQKGLIGKCEFEKAERRAPWALLPAQSFRLLQRVNDLIVEPFDAEPRPLTNEERAKLADALQREEDMTFAKIRTLLNLKKCAFNLERGGEKRLKGNTTAARIRKAIGPRWDELDYGQQQALVGELLGVTDEETMARRGREAWGLDDDTARKLAAVRLQPGFCNLSKKALKKILPRMQQGESYATAWNTVYGEQDWVKIPTEFLPTVQESIVNLRNPAVMRTLTELRKVVNAIIREYGKPDEIHVELARDLKRPPKNRQEIYKRNRAQEKRRDDMRKALQKKGIANPSRADIEKALLWEECNHECPYTGKPISWGALFGEHAQFDVEHIIPFSKSLDNSFLNKTLCYHEENRNRKGNRSPYDTYTEAELEVIVERVKRFNGDAKKRKLELFTMKEINTEEFVSRQLNDTRYASKEAKKFLGYLYGEEALSRVQATGGQVTGYLRWAWDLNKVLSDGDKKSRDDHRHHAVDALVVALTNRATVKRIADAAKRQFDEKGRSRGWWRRVEDPWDGFLQDVQQSIDGITVSHRVSRKVAGRLHEDTNYSAPRKDKDGSEYVVVRKPLSEKFKQKDIHNIVDPAVRAVVQDWYDEHSGDSKAAFADPANHPRMPNGLPIHRVRTRNKEKVFAVGSDGQTRYVTNTSNHHMAIYGTTDSKGRTKWDFEMVSLLEANRRRRKKQSIVQRESAKGAFRFSLNSGCLVQLDDEGGERSIWVVRTISNGNAELCRVNDARDKATMKAAMKENKTGDWAKRSVDTLRKLNCTKVDVSLIGDITPAND
jgi:CRISPR-associated endonuclease Csn1